MHISSLHLYTYSDKELITGACEIQHEQNKVTIKLNEAEREAIQDICVSAYLRERAAIIADLSAHTPARIALADFREVDDTADEVPF